LFSTNVHSRFTRPSASKSREKERASGPIFDVFPRRAPSLDQEAGAPAFPKLRPLVEPPSAQRLIRKLAAASTLGGLSGSKCPSSRSAAALADEEILFRHWPVS